MLSNSTDVVVVVVVVLIVVLVMIRALLTLRPFTGLADRFLAFDGLYVSAVYFKVPFGLPIGLLQAVNVNGIFEVFVHACRRSSPLNTGILHLKDHMHLSCQSCELRNIDKSCLDNAEIFLEILHSL